MSKFAPFIQVGVLDGTPIYRMGTEQELQQLGFSSVPLTVTVSEPLIDHLATQLGLMLDDKSYHGFSHLNRTCSGNPEHEGCEASDIDILDGPKHCPECGMPTVLSLDEETMDDFRDIISRLLDYLR